MPPRGRARYSGYARGDSGFVGLLRSWSEMQGRGADLMRSQGARRLSRVTYTLRMAIAPRVEEWRVVPRHEAAEQTTIDAMIIGIDRSRIAPDHVCDLSDSFTRGIHDC